MLDTKLLYLWFLYMSIDQTKRIQIWKLATPKTGNVDNGPTARTNISFDQSKQTKIQVLARPILLITWYWPDKLFQTIEFRRRDPQSANKVFLVSSYLGSQLFLDGLFEALIGRGQFVLSFSVWQSLDLFLGWHF